LIFPVAWFTFDPVLSGGSGSGLIFSNNNSTVSVEGYEYRVALGSVGFSRGVHYWEFTIDNYTADTDPAFGVARIDVNRNKMLGKFQYFSYCYYYAFYETVLLKNAIHTKPLFHIKLLPSARPLHTLQDITLYF